MAEAEHIEIRPYRPEDEAEWMRVHAIILSISHSWNYSIQERPLYEGYESSKIVALLGGRIVGLMDTQYENFPGELCFQRDSRGGYVLEFGRLPEFGAQEIGRRMIEGSIADAKAKGFTRLEFWSQDRRAQRYYRRLGLQEIGRHYRFRMKPPQETQDQLSREGIAIEYVYAACAPEDWALIRQKHEIIERHPLEPHLCVGFDMRF